MDFLSLAKKRYSCRSYKNQPVEKEKLMRVLEAGRIAPSAVNFQPWHFVVVQEPSNLQLIQQCYHRDWLKTVPCIIILCGDHNTSWKRKDNKDYCDIDISIATDHLTLQATAEGLATCWVCNFDCAMLTKTLGLPSNIEPIVMLPIGYPLDQPELERHQQKRKKTKDIVHFEKINLK
jgi:nitroreductase